VNIHKIAFDIETFDENSPLKGKQAKKLGSNASIDSSTESEIVTKWVDDELRKIKRNLSTEIVPENKQAG